MRRLRAALAGLLLFGSVACGGAGGNPRAADLQKAVTGYLDALRWEAYEGAAFWVADEVRMAVMQAHLENGSRITEYAVLSVRLADPPADVATVLVRLSWFRMPDMTVRSSMLRQEWRQTREGWRLFEEGPPSRPGPPDEDPGPS